MHNHKINHKLMCDVCKKTTLEIYIEESYNDDVKYTPGPGYEGPTIGEILARYNKGKNKC